MSAKLHFTATIYQTSGDQAVTVVGRAGWGLLHLIAAGSAGLTTLARPAPRWSDYIFKLRRAGFVINTVEEGHEGTFSGHHGRYTLVDRVSVSGGNLAEWLASDEGRREFPYYRFFAQEVAA